MTSLLGKIIYASSYIASNALLNLVSYLYGIKYQAIGKENLPKGKAILASNHSLPLNFYSFKADSVDHILIGTKAKMSKIIHFITLDKIFDESNFLIKKYCELTEQIPLGIKKESYKKMMEMATRLLNENEYIGIFSGPVNSYRKSKLPARLALATNTPIVPVQIKIVSRKKEPCYLVSKETAAVQVLFKKAIDPCEFKEKHKNDNLEKALTDEIWKRVYE